jgi:Lar family restriction alleviation protein
MEVLKNCPFCGGNAIMENFSPSDGYIPNSWFMRVRCPICNVVVNPAYDQGKIISADERWNRRSDKIHG